jgi:hypothetical protein
VFVAGAGVLVAGVLLAAGADGAGVAGVADVLLLFDGAVVIGVAGAAGAGVAGVAAVLLSDGAGVAGELVVVDGVFTLTPDGVLEWPAKTKYAMTISATTIMPPMTHPADVLLSRE